MPVLIEPPPTVAARPAIALRDHMSVVHLAVLAGLCALTLFTSLGSVPLWEPDEPRFAAATRQMLRSGDFLDPVFNGGPRWEKPILLYWLQAAPLASGLDEELAMRLPAAVSERRQLFVSTRSASSGGRAAQASWLQRFSQLRSGSSRMRDKD